MVLGVEDASSQLIGPMPALDGAGGAPARHRPVPALATRIRDGASKLAGESPDVALDCRALEQLGGAPLQVLLALATEVESRGGQLTLEDAGPLVIRLIALGGLYPKTPQG
jgi:hypothetical protein